ncbi:MAG: hypothetical protein ABI671_16125 [Burkholderiales bacterium]
MNAASSAATITQALAQSHGDAERKPRVAADSVDQLWRLYGGDWNEPQVVAALLAGVAQLAWRWAGRDGEAPQPRFAVTLAAWPRCLRILLPDDSRHFGVVMVWLRHFEAMLPAGAPPRDLVVSRRVVGKAMRRDDQWLWGDHTTLGAINETCTVETAAPRSAG